jgi:hypothetical protein
VQQRRSPYRWTERDIDVTTLCSTEQEQTNGLAAPAEMSITRNWVGDEAAQEALADRL